MPRLRRARGRAAHVAHRGAARGRVGRRERPVARLRPRGLRALDPSPGPGDSHPHPEQIPGSSCQRGRAVHSPAPWPGPTARPTTPSSSSRDLLAREGLLTDDAQRTAFARENVQRARLAARTSRRAAAAARSAAASSRRSRSSPRSPSPDARRESETVDEDKATQAVAEAVGIPYRKIDPLKLDAQLITRTLSRPFARKHGGAPARAAATARSSSPRRTRSTASCSRTCAASPAPRSSRSSPRPRTSTAPSRRSTASAQQISTRRSQTQQAGGAAGRHEPRAVREPLRPRRARGVVRAGGRRGGVPAPLRLRAARERHPRRAAARGVDHPDADRRRAPPRPPHPEGGPRRDREPVQDPEPARHRR